MRKGKTLSVIKNRVISILAMLAVASVSFTVPVNAEEENDDDTTLEIEVPGSWEPGNFDVQVDGVPVPYEDGKHENTYRLSVDEDSKLVTAILYNGDISNSKNYPEHIRVYEIGRKTVETEASISDESGEVSGDYKYSYFADHIEEFDDVLEYVGFSIRAQSKTVKSGMRFSSSIPASVRNNGVETDDYEYTVEEYGNIHILSREWDDDSRNNMTFANDKALRGKCYNRSEKMDRIIRKKNEGSDNERIVFANTLTDIKEFDVDKNFRSYIKLSRTKKNTEGEDEELYLYGPSAGRSPYYIATKLVEGGTEKNRGILEYSNNIINTVKGTTPDSGEGNNNGEGSEPSTTPSAGAKARALFIGDSIMLGTVLKDGKVHGAGRPRDLTADYTETGVTSKLIGDALASDLGKEVECVLVGNGGATYSEPGSNERNMPGLANEAIQKNDSSSFTPDYIFLLAGVNDWVYTDQGEGPSGNSTIFGNTDPYTSSDQSYYIGIDRTISMLSAKYDQAEIIVCSPLRAWMYSGYGSDTINRVTGKTLKQYSNAQKEVVDKHKGNGEKVHFVNLYDEILSPMGLPDHAPQTTNEELDYLRWFPDGYHPSISAYEVVRDVVIADMKKLNIL